MSQLIALIIAIALGAIVTAIGYVFLGDAFTSNSERGVALQMVNQGSQVEMAMTAYRASNANSAFHSDFATTMVDATDEDGLVDEGFIKDGLVAPVGTYELTRDANNNVFLSITASETVLSDSVCQEVVGLAGGDSDAVLATAADVAAAITALDGSRYSCYTVDNATAGANNIFIYEVE